MSAPLDLCGCFPSAPALHAPHNRPGLERLAYCSGTHPQVLARLLQALDASSRGGPLARLTTRLLDDPSIALLDAFATVSDVLTFYSEQIVNEGFLRTATERRSLLELARLIGYELAPGVAATAWLAFAVEERGQTDPASAEPPQALVPRGTRIQSLPTGGALPQTFETSEDLVARAERNALRPQLSVPAALDPAARSLLLAGTATRVLAGDMLVLAAGEGEGPIVGSPAARRARRVVVEAEHDRTRIDFGDQPAVLVGRAPSGLPASGFDFATTTMNADSVGMFFSNVWTEESQATFFETSGWSLGALWGHQSAPPPAPPMLSAAAPGVYVLRERRAVFGHNAPRLKAALKTDGWDVDWDNPALPITTSDSQSTAATYPHGVDLDAPAPRLVDGSWVVLEQSGSAHKVCRVSSVDERSRADFALSGKVAHVDLAEPGGTPNATGLADFKLRTTTVHIESERLELAPLPLAEAVPAGTRELTLDGIVPGLAAGTPIAFSGEDLELAGVRWTEIVKVTTVVHAGANTKLGFDALVHGYKRSTLELSANVVAATHGETAAGEPLGSGTGAADQRLALRRRPLTHVASAAGSGAASTLEVRVDGVLWQEAPGLYGLGPRDERYVVRRDDLGNTTVIFGDGVRGARPPSGLENVVATYRHGIGAGGMVAGGALTLMQTRPPGIREVINPVAAYGAEDPETRDDARANAPLTVLTLDRVVSLSDYEDYAAAFAGIAKARATALWRGERRLVHVTVAAPDGEDAALETRTALRAALRSAGDPGVDVRVDGLSRIMFGLSANVLLDGRREGTVVVADVRAALAGRFAFVQRAFGQGISEAEVVATALAVDGVVDVQVTTLRPLPPAAGATGPERQDPLLARLARWSTSAAGAIEPAELLFLSPSGATITERAA